MDEHDLAQTVVNGIVQVAIALITATPPTIMAYLAYRKSMQNSTAIGGVRKIVNSHNDLLKAENLQLTQDKHQAEIKAAEERGANSTSGLVIAKVVLPDGKRDDPATGKGEQK